MTPRPCLRAALTAAALVLVAGCSTGSPSTDLEPEPGELDYDIAVNRVAVYEGATSQDLRYDPWTNEALDADGEPVSDPDAAGLASTGTEVMCSYLTSEGDSGPTDQLYGLYVSVIAQEAANAAVLASASDEFRAASGVTFRVDPELAASDERAFEELSEATAALSAGLNDEWVELYALQESLATQVLTVEGAQQAQAAMAERCDVRLSDEDVMTDPATPVQAWLLQPPAMVQGDA